MAILEIIDYNTRNVVIPFRYRHLQKLQTKKDLFAVSVDKLAINRPS